GAIRPYGAGVECPGAHRHEGVRGRSRLAEGVGAPAGDGAIRLHPAAVEAAGAGCREGAARRRGLAEAVVAPTGQGAGVLDAAGEVVAAAPDTSPVDRGAGEGARGRGAWPLPSSPQQATVPFVLIPQLWLVPVLTAVNVPAGGEAWPTS